jgi:hypothetical protein
MMKYLLSLLILAIPGIASATSSVEEEGQRRFQFFYSGNQSGSFSMVTCDYAEYQAENLIELFGGKIIRTRCSGGIEPWGGIFPLNLSITYEEPVVTAESQTTRETYRSDSSNPSCNFNTQMVRQLVRQFPNVKVLRSNSGCFSPQTQYSYDFEITR